jgi:hypothetical protein
MLPNLGFMQQGFHQENEAEEKKSRGHLSSKGKH